MRHTFFLDVGERDFFMLEVVRMKLKLIQNSRLSLDEQEKKQCSRAFLFFEYKNMRIQLSALFTICCAKRGAFIDQTDVTSET